VKAFFDTNILVYTATSDTRKRRAVDCLSRGGVVSVQVLNEFVHFVRRKLGHDWPQIELRLILTVAFGIFLTTSAEASCVCRCVDGQMQPLCSSSIDLPPICPMTNCALPPPSIAPIQPAQLPPLGTSQCSQRQVLNPATRRYEWRSICN
jgi:hypothetical protein